MHFPLDFLKLDLQLDLLLHQSRHRCWCTSPWTSSGPLNLLPLVSDVGTVEILPLHLLPRPVLRSLSTSSTSMMVLLNLKIECRVDWSWNPRWGWQGCRRRRTPEDGARGSR